MTKPYWNLARSCEVIRELKLFGWPELLACEEMERLERLDFWGEPWEISPFHAALKMQESQNNTNRTEP